MYLFLSLFFTAVTAIASIQNTKRTIVQTVVAVSAALTALFVMLDKYKDGKKIAERDIMEQAFKDSMSSFRSFQRNAERYNKKSLDSLNAQLHKYNLRVERDDMGKLSIINYNNIYNYSTPPVDTLRDNRATNKVKEIEQPLASQNFGGVGGSSNPHEEEPLPPIQKPYPEHENVALRDNECKDYAIGGGTCYGKATFINRFDEAIELYQMTGRGTIAESVVIQPHSQGTSSKLRASYNYDGKCEDTFVEWSFYFRTTDPGKPVRYLVVKESVYPCTRSIKEIGTRSNKLSAQQPRY